MRYRRVFFLFALLSSAAPAQWLHYPTPGIPRTRDGKPNLSAPSPRASNGKPDLSGLWQVEPTPFDEMTRLFGPGLDALSVPGDDLRTFSKYGISILADFKPEEAPIRPEAAKILRAPPEVVRDCESYHAVPARRHSFWRPAAVSQQVHSNSGRDRDPAGSRRRASPDFYGWPQAYCRSAAILDGVFGGQVGWGSLVVDTVGFNDKGWLDGMGHPRSEAQVFRNVTGGGTSGIWMFKSPSTIPKCTRGRLASSTLWIWSRTPKSRNTSAPKTKRTAPIWENSRTLFALGLEQPRRRTCA